VAEGINGESAARDPAGVAALPGTGFENINTVVPVMNMVLLARELLLGHWEWIKILQVLVSTSLYAAAAVTLAARVFSTESVVFTDSVSLRATFDRRLMRPSRRPSATLVLIVAAVLFPVWFFVQTSLQPSGDGDYLPTFVRTGWLMPILFVALPAGICVYWRINPITTLAIARPHVRHVLAAVLIGSAAWILAHELFVLQNMLVPVPPEALSDKPLLQAFQDRMMTAFLLIAVIPGICEEFFFRGFLQSGIATTCRKWVTITVTACIFALFHYMLAKFAVTAALGFVLAYLCWQAQSIWPAIIAHVMHNASAVLLAFWPTYKAFLNISDRGPLDHLPANLITAGAIFVGSGLLLCRNSRSTGRTNPQAEHPSAVNTMA